MIRKSKKSKILRIKYLMRKLSTLQSNLTPIESNINMSKVLWQLTDLK